MRVVCGMGERGALVTYRHTHGLEKRGVFLV